MEVQEKTEKGGRIILKPVVWLNTEEFRTVYAGLFSQSYVDQRWAVDRVSAWRTRSEKFPIGMDATDALVRANILYYTVQNNISVSNFADVSLAYCMALVRFINIVLEQPINCRKAYNLKIIARQKGIPEWIVELRHQAAHSASPPLDRLRIATEFSLNWLDENYWKPEIENIKDFVPVRHTINQNQCLQSLKKFQLHQYQAIYGISQSNKHRSAKPSLSTKAFVKQFLSPLAKNCGQCLVNTLKQPEFILSLTAGSKPIVESSELFLEEEAIVLPKSIERFWFPVISLLHKYHLLGDLVIELLHSHEELDDINQRMTIAWLCKILSSSSPSWRSKMDANSMSCKAISQCNPTLNWLEIMQACLKNLSKYIPALIPCIVEHTYPPIATNKKNSLMGLVAIASESLADMHLEDDLPNEEIYDLESVETVLMLQGVIDRGDKSLIFSENPWEICKDEINWGDYPLGTVFTDEGNAFGPKDLEIGLTIVEDETHSFPGEPVVTNMVQDVVNGHAEVMLHAQSSANVEMAEVELAEAEMHINQSSAYNYCAEDFFFFG